MNFAPSYEAYDAQHVKETKTRVIVFFNLLTRGCGHSNCDNPVCASNPKVVVLDPVQAYERAYELAQFPQNIPPCKGRQSQTVSMYTVAAVVDYSILVNKFHCALFIIDIYFSSADSLNSSFVNGPADLDIVNVDLQFTKDTYAKILSVEVLRHNLASCFDTYIMVNNPNFRAITKPYELNQFIILLQNPELLNQVYHLTFLPAIFNHLVMLPHQMQKILVETWAQCPVDNFRHIVQVIQQYITCRLVNDPQINPNIDLPLTRAAQCLGLLYSAHTRAGGIIRIEEFCNHEISERLDLRTDFPAWKNDHGFSYCKFPFLLTAAFKSEVMKIENVVQMRHEMQDAYFRSIMAGPHDPYLVLRIRRDCLMRDTLTQLSSKPKVDLKKQLRVQFLGEEGIDEGGIRKEFFQLIIREIFDPKYGMFAFDRDTNLCWFSDDSSQLKNEPEFELIGLILGLAIYNSVILDVHFPMVVYKKLMNFMTVFDDLKQSHPTLHKGFVQLLEFEGDVAEVYSRTFEVERIVLGQRVTTPLKENGENIILCNSNREEYVNLYVNFILNESVSNQFQALSRGFSNVASGQALKLFRPEELELLVCGSPDLDFNALQHSTKYDGGFTEDSEVIRNFWTIVHQFNTEQKKKLLFFATGSDRVPIGGLCRLNFVIAKSGPDSNRLPSAHTCFNVLLLPDYSTLEKLQSALLTAIQNSEGFGMI